MLRSRFMSGERFSRFPARSRTISINDEPSCLEPGDRGAGWPGRPAAPRSRRLPAAAVRRLRGRHDESTTPAHATAAIVVARDRSIPRVRVVAVSCVRGACACAWRERRAVGVGRVGGWATAGRLGRGEPHRGARERNIPDARTANGERLRF